MFIADGLQRYTGAKAAGYTEIPALTFKSSGVEQEAKLFAMLNGKHRVKATIKRMKEEFTKVELIKVIRDAARKMIEKSLSGFARHKFIQLEIYNKRVTKENKIEL